MTTSACGSARCAASVAGVLEGVSSRESQGQIGKVTRARPPHASLFYSQHTFHPLNLSDEELPRFCGHFIHEYTHCLTA